MGDGAEDGGKLESKEKFRDEHIHGVGFDGYGK